MQTLAKAVFNDNNLSLLPLYVDGGSLPALIVGPGEGARAQIAAEKMDQCTEILLNLVDLYK